MSSSNGNHNGNGNGHPRPLTLKQERFITYYLGEARGNATLAAKLAGYEGNDVTLEAVGRENLGKPRIRLAIEKASAKSIMTADEILQELTRVAGCSWEKFLEFGDVDTIPGEKVFAKLNLRDKLKALELMGKYRALFTEKREITVEITDKRSKVLESAQRLAEQHGITPDVALALMVDENPAIAEWIN